MRFSRLLILASVLLASCGDGSNNPSGRHAALNPKIIDGTEVTESDSPQFVQVKIGFADGKTGLCSGTSLGGDAILTAGHCFAAGKVSSVQVINQGRIISIARVVIHPGYIAKPIGIFNDAAVLISKGPHGIPGLGIIKTRPMAAGDTIGIWGYGLDENGEAGTLHRGEMTVDEATPNHLISLFQDSQNTCSGDSGGAATFAITDEAGNISAVGIVGITSTGSREDCGKGDLTLFTNVQSDSILNFILSQAPKAVVL